MRHSLMLSFQKSFNSGFIQLVLVKTIMDEKIEIPIKTVYLASKPYIFGYSRQIKQGKLSNSFLQSALSGLFLATVDLRPSSQIYI